MTDKSFYVTTPIYYVNDKPHIGHAYTTIACDVMARFMRLAGRDTYFLTGTDEHGQKVAKSADAKGIAPQQFTDVVSQNFRDLVATGENVLHVTNDDFIRTTELRHKDACQALWQKIAGHTTPKGNSCIYKDSYGGWYAVRDEAYYTETELTEKDGKKVAPSGAEVEWVEEESYFFRLSDYDEALLELYNAADPLVQPQSRNNEVKRFVEGGLKDLSISRTTFDWGVPVPNDDNHVMYVWIDALTNYLTTLGYPDTHGAKYKQFWGNATHIVGKDILRFHAVYWPAFLLAADLPLPERIVAHGWWTIEGEKMSKSLGNVLSPEEMITQAGGIDQLRYFMLRAMSFGNDGDFSQERMIDVINADLANNIGNLSQRTLSMIQKNCDGAVPPFDLQGEDKTLLSHAETMVGAYQTAMEQFDYKGALESVIAIANQANEYIDVQAPWKLKKENPERMQTVLYTLAETVRRIAILLQPFCPTAAAAMLTQLCVSEGERSFACLDTAYALKSGVVLPKPEGVFPRLQPAPKEEAANAG